MIREGLKNLYDNITLTNEEIQVMEKEWNVSKVDLRNLFLNGESRISKKIEYNLSRKDIKRRLADIFTETSTNIGYNFTEIRNLVESFLIEIDSININNEELGVFIKRNRIDGENSTKITKYLKTLLVVNNIDYEKFLVKYSMLIQESSIEDTLYISTLPEDLITISVNTNGWKSCMSSLSNYIYPFGLIEYLNNPNVMVAYLKSKNNLKGGVHNKKWRALIEVRETPEEYVFYIRKNYPSCRPKLNQQILSILELKETYTDEFEGYNEIFNYTHAYQDAPAVIGIYEKENPAIILDEIKPYACPICGESDLCNCTSFGATCSECGRRLPEEEVQRNQDGVPFCEECFYELHTFCSFCGEPVEIEHAITTSYGETLCGSCYADNYFTCDSCGEEQPITKIIEYDGKELCEECFIKDHPLKNEINIVLLKDKCIRKNVVIHLDSPIKAIEVSRVMHSLGYHWKGGEDYIKATNWNTYKESTCYSLDSQGFAPIGYYMSRGVTIVEYSDILLKTKGDDVL